MVLRVVLLVLKHLIHFSKSSAITRSLEAVLGPAVTDTFRKRFCKVVGNDVGFGNPLYKCLVTPPVSVMPGLSLQSQLGFKFSFANLHGETYGDFLARVDAESDAVERNF